MRIHRILLMLSVFVLFSCQEKSLQKYLVEKQDDRNFLKADIAPGMLEGFKANLSPDEQETLNSIKKINVIAYKIHDGNIEEYQQEKETLESILSQDKYNDLTRIRSNEWSVNFLYTGTETAIGEVISSASADNTGFVPGRLRRNKTKPDQPLPSVRASSTGNIATPPIEAVMRVLPIHRRVASVD